MYSVFPLFFYLLKQRKRGVEAKIEANFVAVQKTVTKRFQEKVLEGQVAKETTHSRSLSSP
jgi:hypothetical protein